MDPSPNRFIRVYSPDSETNSSGFVLFKTAANIPQISESWANPAMAVACPKAYCSQNTSDILIDDSKKIWQQAVKLSILEAQLMAEFKTNIVINS